jgi:hypothetical protein
MFARPMRSTYASPAPRPTASGHLDMLAAGPPQNSRSVQVVPVIAVAGDRRHIGGYLCDPAGGLCRWLANQASTGPSSSAAMNQVSGCAQPAGSLPSWTILFRAL